jgi:hypothetical protein
MGCCGNGVAAAAPTQQHRTAKGELSEGAADHEIPPVAALQACATHRGKHPDTCA